MEETAQKDEFMKTHEEGALLTDKDVPFNYSENDEMNKEDPNVFSFNKYEQDLKEKPYLNMENLQRTKQDKTKFKDVIGDPQIEKEFTVGHTQKLAKKVLEAKLSYNQK